MTTYQTSGAFNYTTNRDAIITRALRIIGAVGQGETPTTAAITEGAEALNDLVKEWEADGMPLWAIRNFKIVVLSGVPSYVIADGPLKVHDVFYRNTTSLNDSPMILVTRQEYNDLGNKSQTGTPSQVWYNPPGNINQSGEVFMYVTPNAVFAAANNVYVVGQIPFENFNASTDIPDFPQYWYNAIKWGLADQLSYEYGVGVTERSQITKKALYHKEQALSFGTEEGSLYIQPEPQWTN